MPPGTADGTCCGLSVLGVREQLPHEERLHAGDVLMRKETAEEISAAMLRIYADLNRLTLLVQEKESAKDFAEFRGASATLLQIILTEVLNRLYVKYPDLSPPDLRQFFPAKTVRSRKTTRARPLKKKSRPTER